MKINLSEKIAPFIEKLAVGQPVDRSCVGLNMGFSSFKAVKLHLSKDAAELTDYRVINNQLDMEETLKKATQELGVKSVNFSLSGQQALIRYIDFPRMSQQELKQALKFEVQKHLPFSAAEVNFDAFILRNNLPDNKMKVLLAAVKKELLDQRLKLLRSAGVEVGIVEIDSLSLANAFNFNYLDDPNVKSKAVALLNIGSALSNLNIVEDGMPALSRDIPLGGNNLTQKIAEVFGTDFKEAEVIKLNPQKHPADKMNTALDAVLSRLAHEVRSSFDYFESRSVVSVERIYVSGGASMFSGFNQLLMGHLGIPVDTWDCFKKIGIASGQDAPKIKALAGQLAVAAGLALRG